MRFCIQGHHAACHPSSTSHISGYIPSKTQLTDPRTAQQLLTNLRATYIFRNALEFNGVSGMICESIN